MDDEAIQRATDAYFNTPTGNVSPEGGNDLQAKSNSVFDAGRTPDDVSYDSVLAENIRAFSSGMNNILSFGAMEEIDAGMETLLGYGEGPYMDFVSRYMENLNARAAEEAQLAEDNPYAYGIGQGTGVLGQAIFGGAVANATNNPITRFAQSGPIRNVVANTLMGAIGGGTYNFMEGESVGEGVKLGAAGGAIGSTAALGFMKLGQYVSEYVKRKRGKSGKGRSDAYDYILSAYQTKYGVPPEEFPHTELKEKLLKLGDDATMADVDDVFTETMARTIKSSKNSDRGLQITKSISERAKNAPKSFENQVRNVFSDRVRTVKDVRAEAAERYEALSPEYERILAQSQGNTVNDKVPADLVTNRFKLGNNEPVGGARGQAEKRILKLMDGYKGSARLPVGEIKFYTPRALHAIRTELDGILNSGKFSGKSELPLDKDLRRRVSLVRKDIDKLLKQQADGIAAIDDHYATEAQIVKGFTTARQFLGNAKSAAEVEEYLERATLAERNAFAEGAKEYIINQIQRNPETAAKNIYKNDAFLNKLYYVLPDMADEILATAERSMVMRNTEKVKDIAADAAEDTKLSGSGPLRTAVQKAIIAGWPLGVSSNVATAGAAERLASVRGLNMSREGLDYMDDFLSSEGLAAMLNLDDLRRFGTTPSAPNAGLIPGLGTGSVAAGDALED